MATYGAKPPIPVAEVHSKTRSWKKEFETHIRSIVLSTGDYFAAEAAKSGRIIYNESRLPEPRTTECSALEGFLDRCKQDIKDFAVSVTPSEARLFDNAVGVFHEASDLLYTYKLLIRQCEYSSWTDLDLMQKAASYWYRLTLCPEKAASQYRAAYNERVVRERQANRETDAKNADKTQSLHPATADDC